MKGLLVIPPRCHNLSFWPHKKTPRLAVRIYCPMVILLLLPYGQPLFTALHTPRGRGIVCSSRPLCHHFLNFQGFGGIWRFFWGVWPSPSPPPLMCFGCCKSRPYYASSLARGWGGKGPGWCGERRLPGKAGTEASRTAGGSGSWAAEWALAQTSVCSLQLELLAGWMRVCACMRACMRAAGSRAGASSYNRQHRIQDKQWRVKILHIERCFYPRWDARLLQEHTHTRDNTALINQSLFGKKIYRLQRRDVQQV